MDPNKVLFPALVLDVNDPLNTGRIRAFVKTGEYESVVQVPDDKKWTYEDTLVILPLIPMYFYGTPVVGEYVHVIYYNSKERFDNNKFYIQGPLSRPWNNKKEDYNNAQSVMASGENLKGAYQPRNPKTGEVQKILEGVYPNPGDTAIIGRGTSDIVIRENDVLVRSGKYKSTSNDNIPVAKNDKRSFLQISSFELENRNAGTEVKINEIIPDAFVKRFVQWSITNLESTGTTYDGIIKFYNLDGNVDLFKASVINNSFEYLQPYLSLPLYSIEFTGKTVDETALLINTFIRSVNDGYINIPTYPEYLIDSQFPFYYGPDSTTYSYVTTSSFAISNEIFSTNKAIELYNKVTFNTKFKQKGKGLMWKKNPPELGILPNYKTEKINKREYVINQVNYSVLGGNKIYLLSHDSVDKYKVDLTNTLYGIDQDKLAVDIYNSTTPMVRGGELVSLLKDIVNFLLNHVHPIPGREPIQEYLNKDGGASAKKITEVLRSPEKNLLSKNIRIN
jgi:hypothetical protein